MMRVIGKYLLFLSLVLPLLWGAVASNAQADGGFEGAITYLGVGHAHDADHHETADPSHLVHHGCHSHLSDRTLVPGARPVDYVCPAYLSMTRARLSGRDFGPDIRPPASL